VSVIMPARNEERAVGAAVASLMAQDYPDIEVIVVDDQSTDRTRLEAAEAIGSDPRGRLVGGTDLPDGWVGKSWAAWQGYQHSTGDWLLFTDADVIQRPDCIGRCLALATALDRGITLIPRIHVGTPAEAVVLPAAFAMIATFVAPGPLVRASSTSTAMAAGGFMLMPRQDYEAVGGHRAIRGRMVDDVSMAQRLKAAGRPLRMVDGVELAHLRMYDGAEDMWLGWRKNASFGAADVPRAVVGSSLVAGTAAIGPAATIFGILSGCRALAALGALGWCAQILTARINSRAVGGAPTYALAFPAGVAFIAAAAIRGAIDRLSGKGAVWRGRRYPTAD
jgi:GT2 family glycosyltransferase